MYFKAHTFSSACDIKNLLPCVIMVYVNCMFGGLVPNASLLEFKIKIRWYAYNKIFFLPFTVFMNWLFFAQFTCPNFCCEILIYRRQHQWKICLPKNERDSSRYKIWSKWVGSHSIQWGSTKIILYHCYPSAVWLCTHHMNVTDKMLCQAKEIWHVTWINLLNK